MSTGLLHHRTVGKGPKVCYVLHGLLGSGRNWQSFVKSLHDLNQSWRFMMIDLRGHGHTERNGFAAPHTIHSCVEDLERLASTSGIWPNAKIGHSLCGKVLLQLANSPKIIQNFQSHSTLTDSVIEQFIVDSFPGRVRPDFQVNEQDSVTNVLKIVQTSPYPIPSRNWVMEECRKANLSLPTAQWLSSNVIRLDHHQQVAFSSSSHATVSHKDDAEGYTWLFDPTTAAELYQSHNQLDLWHILGARSSASAYDLDDSYHLSQEHHNHSVHESSHDHIKVLGPPKNCNVNLIMASKSARWSTPSMARKVSEAKSFSASHPNRGNVSVQSVHAGHWIHAENPSGLLDVMSDYFKR